jgi:hypothetical protein
MSLPSPPTIHILDKANYSKHRVITLPNEPLLPLAPSSLRFQSRILGLTTNNLTYSRLGHLMGWYDIYPLPPHTPSPYNDETVYGRIAVWGYAEILESTFEGIEVGQSMYGFLPISENSREDVRVECATTPVEGGKTRIRNQIVVLDQHRQHLWKIYNRYQICPPLAQLVQSKGDDSLGWDSLMQGLFATGYNLSS